MEAALAAFLASERPKSLVPATEELFPLPGEDRWFTDVPLRIAE